jgi:hypothetical protein
MDKPKVFVSHIAEEAALAEIIKNHICRDFLELIDVFVSSDSTSISVGNKWLNDVDAALKTAKIELILCSKDSVERPWINFEAGAGWVKGIPVVPICHTGMRPVDLPIPLNMLQAIEAKDRSGLEKLYARLAGELGASIPSGDFDQIVREVRDFEEEYGIVRVVAGAVRELIDLLPGLELVFLATPVHTLAQGDVSDIILDKMRPHLDLLQSRGMIQYATGRNKMVLSSSGGGNMIKFQIQVEGKYYQIADKVMKK